MADDLEEYDDTNINIPKEEEEQNKDSYLAAKGSSFRDFMLRPELMRAITERGFEHPSEVQSQTIPHATHNSDLICQAKSGMGKTAIFVLAIIQQLNVEELNKDHYVAAVVLAHTRELAVQIGNEFDYFLRNFRGISTCVVYGGPKAPTESENIAEIQRKKPAIIIATPGRLMSLVQAKKVDLSRVSHFVVDECDNVLKKQYDSTKMRQQMHDIYMNLPSKKQVMMFTATLDEDTRELCKKYMKSPVEIVLSNAQLTLFGLQQYHVELVAEEKNKKLRQLIDELDYNQMVIFTSAWDRVEALSGLLSESGIPTDFTHARLPVDKRIENYNKFKRGNTRILVTNDLFARGIDIEKVNVVINYDMPETATIYLHRVGRAGRFNTRGLAISFVSSAADAKVLNEIQETYSVRVPKLPDELEPSSYSVVESKE